MKILPDETFFFLFSFFSFFIFFFIFFFFFLEKYLCRVDDFRYVYLDGVLIYEVGGVGVRGALPITLQTPRVFGRFVCQLAPTPCLT